MRFDWYSGTLYAQPSLWIERIKSDFGEGFEPAEPQKMYKQALKHRFFKHKISWGGHNPHPFLVATGGQSHAFAEFVRSSGLRHSVSRVDVAQDFLEHGGYDRLNAIIEPIARAARCEVIFQGDPDPNSLSGRTMYYGSTKSDVRIVVYEKGKERLKAGFSDAPIDWVRVELRIRPRKDRKQKAAHMSPKELWGFSRWSQQVSGAIDGRLPAYVPDESRRQCSLEQTFSHMLKQYGPAMVQYSGKYGLQRLFDRITETVGGDDSSNFED